jgi:hypothetical protein
MHDNESSGSKRGREFLAWMSYYLLSGDKPCLVGVYSSQQIA